MFLYYQTWVLGGKREIAGQAHFGIQNIKIDNLHRTNITPAKYYLIQRKFEEKKKNTTDKNLKAKISKEIRILQGRTTVEKLTGTPNRRPDNRQHSKEITDLNNGVIGRFYHSSSKKSRENLILLGRRMFIRDASIGFVYSKLKKPCMRTTLYLTYKGKDSIRKYVKKHLNQQLAFYNERTQKIKKKSSHKIRKKMDRRLSYDVKIDDIDIHINLKGKIEIFTFHPGLESLLCDDFRLTREQRILLERFTEHNFLKKWVKQTTPDFNMFVGKTFEVLSQKANSILEEYFYKNAH